MQDNGSRSSCPTVTGKLPSTVLLIMNDSIVKIPRNCSLVVVQNKQTMCFFLPSINSPNITTILHKNHPGSPPCVWGFFRRHFAAIILYSPPILSTTVKNSVAIRSSALQHQLPLQRVFNLPCAKSIIPYSTILRNVFSSRIEYTTTVEEQKIDLMAFIFIAHES